MVDVGLRQLSPTYCTIQHVKSLHDQLLELQGNIYICDPYLDASTLEHLDSCTEGTNLFLLTHNTQDAWPSI